MNEQSPVFAEGRLFSAGARPGGARPLLQRYGCALASVAVAIVLRRLLDPALGTAYPYATVCFAILVAAWFGGRGPGLAAVVLGALGAIYFLVPPRGTFIVEDSSQQVGLSLYLAIGVGIALLGGAIGSARLRAEAGAQAARKAEAALREAKDRIDLTERRRMEQALGDHPEQWRVFVEQAPAAIAMLDLDMRYIATSERWLEDYGFVGQSLRGRSHYDVFPELPEKWKAVHRRCLAGAVERSDAEPFTSADGSVRWVRWEIRPWHAAQRIGGIFIHSEDVTARKEAEEQLRASEARYRQVVDLSLECIWIYGGGRILFANKQANLLLGGGRPEALIGRDPVDLVHPQDRAGSVQRVKQLERNEAIPLRQVRFLSDDGRTVTLEVQAVPFQQDGRLSVLVVGRDVSERIRAEQSARESEGRFRILADTMPALLWMSDATGACTFVNRRWVDYTGRALEDELGEGYADNIHPEEREARKELRRAMLAEHRPASIEYRLRGKDGRYRWFLATAVPRWSDDGSYLGHVGVLIDVDERRRLAARIRTIVDNTVDGLITIDQDGIVTTFSGPAQRIFGYTEQEVSGRNVSMLMPEPYRSGHDTYIANYLRTGIAKIIGIGREVQGRRKDGSLFPMDIAIGELPTQDGRREFVATVRDISERRRLEDQLLQAQKMETVGQLTGGIAHDFNNLLTIVIGNLDSVVDSAPDDIRPGIEVALRGADRGAALVKRLLAFSRRQVLNPEALDLNQVADGMNALLHSTLGEDIETRLKLRPALWLARADRGQVENAVVNLAVNARDAMPDGGKLTIETDNVHLDADYVAHNPEVSAGDYVMIAVTDTGTGMPPEVVERAFEPFFTTKEVGRGTGLGLSMIYGFARQSGGHLRIYSEVGHGTTVRLYVPRQPDADAAAAAGPAAVDHPRGGETVLVVEDDADVRALAVAMLRSLGYRVLEAVDGQQALQILDGDASVDLLFTDVVMPGGMTGRQLADTMAARRPRLRTLFTSGYTETAIIRQGKLDPHTHFLSKPYRRQDLARKLREVLDAPEPG